MGGTYRDRVRAHLKNPRRARPSDARRIGGREGVGGRARARSAARSGLAARDERASDARAEAPAARRSQPARVFEMRSSPTDDGGEASTELEAGRMPFLQHLAELRDRLRNAAIC